ncbi:carboxypeptidase-like regulatory domain-containing protein [Paraflavitalea sp. CAU 1676]|uniref:carboxypeptidase-like regulatory domain-containing protein n=1 Tax=Paraflavitalea sp. CAU 1676 TaxID=3032598 RepID=UPI0023DB201E|nr:carboxypeptidase-like regulatory domain-containing protein [Paraflavitalea sp. CAU 1676]MDF2189018.1 carboxypeptidase-like regulatory domain-containing protein [Paraflavitalea sp. CAU 1676]
MRRVITGIVRNYKDEPVSGATVMEKGATNGVVTSEEGRFSISVAGKNVILVITYTGYVPQEIAAGNNNTQDVVLSLENKGLNEVVVVGYGAQ